MKRIISICILFYLTCVVVVHAGVTSLGQTKFLGRVTNSSATIAWNEDLSLQKLNASPANGPEGFYRETYEFWSNGPVLSNDHTKYYLAYQRNCEGSNPSPIEVIVAQYNATASGDPWTFSNAGPAYCHSAHNMYSQVFQFPSDYSNATYRNRLIVFFVVDPASDPFSCTEISTKCIRYTISNSADVADGWGSVQYLHEPDDDQITRLPLGMFGGFSSNGTLHMIGQGWIGSIMYARMNTDLKFTTHELIKGTNGSNEKSPGCAFSAKLFSDGDMYIVTAPDSGDCGSTVDSMYFFKSTDGGDNWTSAAGAGSFTKEAGTTCTSGFCSNNYIVHAEGHVRNMAVSRLSDETPIILEGDPSPSSYRPVIRKWTSGTTWDQSALGAGTFVPTAVALQIASDTQAIIHFADISSGTLREYSMNPTTMGSWSSVLVLKTSEHDYTNRVRTSLVTPTGQAQRVLVNFADYLSTGTPGRKHDIYFVDRKVTDIIAQTPPS